MKKINCPICGSSEYNPIYQKDNYNLVKCQNCLLFYINPRPNLEEIQVFYSKDYFQSAKKDSSAYEDYVGNKQGWQKGFLRNILRIKRVFHLPLNSKVLDVGCATGFFLDLIRSMGWRGEGIEVSKWAASFGNKKLGLKIKHGTIDSLKTPKEKFDLITAWETIEHIQGLDSFLKNSKKLLKQNGKLVLSTPNINSLDYLVNKEAWFRLDMPVHLYLFSPRTITKLLKKYNFKIVKIETEEDFGTFVNMAIAPLKRMKIFSNTDMINKDTNNQTNHTLDNNIGNKSFSFKSFIRVVFIIFLYILYPLFNILFFRNGWGGGMTVYALNQAE